MPQEETIALEIYIWRNTYRWVVICRILESNFVYSDLHQSWTSPDPILRWIFMLFNDLIMIL